MPDTDTSNVTNAELMRAVVLIRKDIEGVNKKFDNVPTQSDYVYLKERIADLENWQTWALRLGVPALFGVVINITNTISAAL